MLHLRIYAPAALTESVVQVLRDEPTVSTLAVLKGASVRPPGDLVLADVPRETANVVVDRLTATGVHVHGSIQLEPVRSWISQAGFDAERAAPGAESDAIVWVDVIQRAYEESQLTFAFATFMVFATLIASIGIVLDSQILIIGAMVLGPEFGAVAALGIALLRRRFGLLRHALRTLAIGFAIAVLATTLVMLALRWLGWVDARDLTSDRLGHELRLPARPLVVPHRPDRRLRRRPRHDLGEGGGSHGGLHLGHDHPRRGQHRCRARLRPVARGAREPAAARRQHHRDGTRGLAHARRCSTSSGGGSARDTLERDWVPLARNSRCRRQPHKRGSSR